MKRVLKELFFETFCLLVGKLLYAFESKYFDV